jgi:hypothetical protein
VPPPDDGGLIPGEDGCLYYPDGGLAECPDGKAPGDGGCTPNADGSEGCVVPGPVAEVTEHPVAAAPPDDAGEPGAVVDDSSGPGIDTPPQPEAVGAQPGAALEAASAAPGFDPAAAAARIRVAVAPFVAWLAAFLAWLLGMS